MTEYLVVDTEQNGLFDYKLPADAPGQPRMAAMTMIRVGADMTIQGEHRFLVKPDGWSMTPESSKVNKLTDEILMRDGVPIREVLDAYTAAIKEGRVFVAHNAQHDAKSCRAECRRAGMPDLFEETKQLCTMRGLTDVCKIPPKGNRGGYKWPSLSEACVFFKFDMFGDHTASGDAMACYMLLREMHKLGLPLEGAVHYAKEKPAAPAQKPLRQALEESVAQDVIEGRSRRGAKLSDGDEF